MMFAVITPALITGAFAERMKFSGLFSSFSLLWATIVYDPIAHWVWGTGGWLHALGALDFAGGTVVHQQRHGRPVRGAGHRQAQGLRPGALDPHNLPFAVLGARCCGSAGSASTPAAL